MRTCLVAMFIGAAACLPAAGNIAHASVIARYECNIMGTMGQEPIGDRPGHMLVSVQYACQGTDGLMKGALYTAHVATEWENQKGTYLYGVGIHRMSDGYAVMQVTEGTGSLVMQDGMPTVSEGNGKAVFKLASGRLAALSGRTVAFTSRLTGHGHFIYEIMD